jgi:hypothetical protein
LAADQTSRDLVARYVRALHERDLDTIQTLQHADFVEDYPQSGERIRGRRDWRAIYENYPGGLVGAADVSKDRVIGGEDRWLMGPTFTMVRLSGEGDMHTAILKLRYPDESQWYMVSFMELRDGLVLKATTFFAETFEPPEWRAQWIEPMPDEARES